MSKGLGCSDLKMPELRTRKKAAKVSSGGGREGDRFQKPGFSLFKGKVE